MGKVEGRSDIGSRLRNNCAIIITWHRSVPFHWNLEWFALIWFGWVGVGWIRSPQRLINKR